MQTGPSTVKDGAFRKCGWSIFILLWSSSCFHSTFLSSLALAFPALDGIVLLESLGLPACLSLCLCLGHCFPPILMIPQSLSLCLSVSPCVTISVHMRPYHSLFLSSRFLCALPPDSPSLLVPDSTSVRLDPLTLVLDDHRSTGSRVDLCVPEKSLWLFN